MIINTYENSLGDLFIDNTVLCYVCMQRARTQQCWSHVARIQASTGMADFIARRGEKQLRDAGWHIGGVEDDLCPKCGEKLVTFLENGEWSKAGRMLLHQKEPEQENNEPTADYKRDSVEASRTRSL